MRSRSRRARASERPRAARRHSSEAVVIWSSWQLIKESILSFIDDDALSRGAAISFYTATSIAPVLLIVIAVAGLAVGREAAQNGITVQLSGLMGQQTADVLQTAIASAAGKKAGTLATVMGIITLMVTASGVFGEMQSALNVIWKAKPRGTTVSRLIRARAASLGLVAALGFLLAVSLAISAMLTAFGGYLNSVLPFGKLILTALNLIISLALLTILFAAICKVLPDRVLQWRDVLLGSIICCSQLERLLLAGISAAVRLRRATVPRGA
jgi:membrane protein